MDLSDCLMAAMPCSFTEAQRKRAVNASGHARARVHVGEPLRCRSRAQAPPPSSPAGAAQNRKTVAHGLLHRCHPRIKNLLRVEAVTKADSGDAAGPSGS